MVDKQLRNELAPLEERIRRMGGERSYAFGIAVGEALLALSRRLSSRHPRHGSKAATSSLGEHVAAGD